MYDTPVLERYGKMRQLTAGNGHGEDEHEHEEIVKCVIPPLHSLTINWARDSERDSEHDSDGCISS